MIEFSVYCLEPVKKKEYAFIIVIIYYAHLLFIIFLLCTYYSRTLIRAKYTMIIYSY